jgi:glycerol kinase
VPLALWRLPDGSESWCLEGHVATAGGAIEWLVEVGLLPAVEALDAVAGEVQGSDGVVFVPALEGLGTPYADPGAAGLLGGLTRGSRGAQVVRAALEGVAQRCADLWDALEPTCPVLPVDGGLARSGLLLQTLADLLGRPLEPAREVETSALGGAWLAALACGLLDGPEAVRALRRCAPPIEPRLGEAERVRRRARWRRLVDERVCTR